MTGLHRSARVLALLLLVFGFLLPSTGDGGQAAMAGAATVEQIPCHDMNGGGRPAKPSHPSDCCLGASCAFNLAFPAPALRAYEPAIHVVAYASERAAAWRGIVAVPATHPPKAA